MESNPSAEARGAKSRPYSRHAWPVARGLISIGLLAALLYWQSIDLHALTALGNEFWMVIAAGVLICLTVPLGALRWLLELRLVGVALPFVPVFHIQCIATSLNQILFGPTSGDAIRGVYAWRWLRRGGARIATSLMVDRAFGLLGLIVLAFVLTALKWQRVQQVPQLMVLGWSLAACLAGGLAGCVALLVAPELLSRLRAILRRYQRVDPLLARAQEGFTAFRRRPVLLAGAFCLSLLGHCMILLAFVVIANILQIGSLTSLDYAIAALLALVANMLPFTPGGLGVGEAAFDQLCRWIEPISSAAPYASIFFAFRAVSMLTLLLGLTSFVVYQNNADHVGDP
jgi:glycosyltransferase 2 family protein